MLVIIQEKIMDAVETAAWCHGACVYDNLLDEKHYVIRTIQYQEYSKRALDLSTMFLIDGVEDVPSNEIAHAIRCLIAKTEHEKYGYDFWKH